MEQIDWEKFNEKQKLWFDSLTPYEKALIYLRAVANWSDKELENPLIARACRDCALKGLEILGEKLIP